MFVCYEQYGLRFILKYYYINDIFDFFKVGKIVIHKPELYQVDDECGCMVVL